MTFLTKDIRDHLAASAAITNAFSDKIYAEVIPQGVEYEQAIVINDLSNQPEYILAGEVGNHTSIIQIDVWTDGQGGKARANELGELVRNRMSGYMGRFGEGVYGKSRMIRNNTVAAAPIDASGMHRRRNSMDFEIIHTASVPTLT